MHLGGHCYNRVELLTSKGAEKSTVASAADCEVEADSLTAGHERKHNACRAESEVVVVDIPISAELLQTFIECYQDTGRGPGSAACPVMVGKSGGQTQRGTQEW